MRHPLPSHEMASLNLKLMGPPGVDHLDNRFSVVLRDFLQPTSALTLDAATQLTLDALPNDAAHSHESWSLAETCVELAEQIPYHHTSQLKLAALMENLLRSKKLLAIPVENVSNRCLCRDHTVTIIISRRKIRARTISLNA